MAQSEKRKHYCPPFPPGWTVKLTGPAWVKGQSVGEARNAWAAHLRRVQNLTPCPSQAGKGGKIKQ